MLVYGLAGPYSLVGAVVRAFAWFEVIGPVPVGDSYRIVSYRMWEACLYMAYAGHESLDGSVVRAFVWFYKVIGPVPVGDSDSFLCRSHTRYMTDITSTSI